MGTETLRIKSTAGEDVMQGTVSISAWEKQLEGV